MTRPPFQEIPVPRFPQPLPATALAIAALAGGCSVRDEQAVAGGRPTWWSAVGGGGDGGLIAGSPTGPASAAVIEYVEGFEAGRRRSADAGLPMLVVFRATWCPWSGELVQATVGNPRIVELSRRFVCVAVDADRDPATCRDLGIVAFPTVVLVDATGTERHRATGSAAASGLAAAMGELLASPNRPSRVAGTAAPVR